MEYCGVTCSPSDFRNPWAPTSFLSQIISALAVAESVHGLEHRDLHICNILFVRTDNRYVTYVNKDHKWSVNTLRVMVKIIDFTHSRISNDNDIYYKKLEFEGAEEPLPPILDPPFWLNHQNVYKLMDKCLKKNYEKFQPATNVLWIKHLIEVMLNETEMQSPSYVAADPRLLTPLNLLRNWNSRVLRYTSADSVLRNLIMQNNSLMSNNDP